MCLSFTKTSCGRFLSSLACYFAVFACGALLEVFSALSALGTCSLFSVALSLCKLTVSRLFGQLKPGRKYKSCRILSHRFANVQRHFAWPCIIASLRRPLRDLVDRRLLLFNETFRVKRATRSTECAQHLVRSKSRSVTFLRPA